MTMLTILEWLVFGHCQPFGMGQNAATVYCYGHSKMRGAVLGIVTAVFWLHAKWLAMFMLWGALGGLWGAFTINIGFLLLHSRNLKRAWRPAALPTVWHGAKTRAKVGPTKVGDLTFSQLRSANLARSTRWCPGGIDDWTLSDWGVAMAGEAGEVCDVIKKLNRARNSMPGNLAPCQTVGNVVKIGSPEHCQPFGMEPKSQPFGMEPK